MREIVYIYNGIETKSYAQALASGMPFKTEIREIPPKAPYISDIRREWLATH